MKTKPIEVKSKGLTVKIYVSKTAKGYTTYLVADYSSGNRKLLGFADEKEARAKALEICESNTKAQQLGDADMARLYLEKRIITTRWKMPSFWGCASMTP